MDSKRDLGVVEGFCVSVLQLVPCLFPCSMASVESHLFGMTSARALNSNFECLPTFATCVCMQSDAWVFMIHVSRQVYEAHAVMWGWLAEECTKVFTNCAP